MSSLQSIRVKLRAEQGGGMGGWKWKAAGGGGRGLGDGILANVERGPIKAKARESMNDLVLKHTWGLTYLCKAHSY